MPLRPPPPPVSLAEFRRRWKAGGRTFAELDPAFDAWLRETRRSLEWQTRMVLICWLLSLLGGILALFYVWR